MLTADKIVELARAWRIAHDLGPALQDREAMVFRSQSRVLKNQAGSIFMEDLVKETIAGIFMHKYPAARFASGELITIQPGARGAQAFAVNEMARTGLAPETGLVTGDSDDIEEVGLQGDQRLQAYATVARAFSWSIDDLETAQLQGAFDLIGEKSGATREQLDEDFDSYIANGVAGKWPSIYNYPGSLQNIAAPTGNWAAASSADIVADVGHGLDVMSNETEGVVTPDTALFSRTDWSMLRLPYGPEGARTRLELLQANYPEITTWTWERHLPQGTMFLYRNDPNYVAAKAPVRFEFLPPEAKAMRFRVIVRNRFGGVYSRQPRSMLKMVGL